MKKGVLALLVFFVLTSFNYVKAQTGNEFETQYEVDYDVQENGETIVNYDVTIINKRSDVVATKYSLSLKQINVLEVTGSDKEGPLKIEKVSEGDTITLSAPLNEQVVGLDKKNYIKLRVKTKSVATKMGEVWNVNIPQIQNMLTTSKYDVTLRVPQSLGPTIFITPQVKEELSGTKRVYKFTKKDVGSTGISASYGKHQLLNYKLKYQLENTSPFSVNKEVALPPDIAERQKVYYTSLKPSPVKITKDKDGNVLATYIIKGKSTLEIELTGNARIMGKQTQVEFGGRFEEIPSDIKRIYTSAKKYWETQSPLIKEIASNLKDENKNVTENARDVYNFVVQNLQYDFEAAKKNSVTRKGAVGALSNRESAACMEFTDLFIAIARAAGIPAREINGYAFTSNDSQAPVSVNLNGADVLHSWPEYYDPNFGWIGIDPTWGATSKTDYFTKLDTNHFAFVVKGIDPEYPLPAGSYKIDETTKTVEIDFADSSSPFEPYPKDDVDQAKGFVLERKTPVVIIAVIVGLAVITIALVYSILARKLLNK